MDYFICGNTFLLAELYYFSILLQMRYLSSGTKINKLTKQYGNKLAVDRFSATFTEVLMDCLVQMAQVRYIMRICATYYVPHRGILLDGVSISTLGEDYRAFRIFTTKLRYPDFTAWDFMMYLSSLRFAKLTAILDVKICWRWWDFMR